MHNNTSLTSQHCLPFKSMLSIITFWIQAKLNYLSTGAASSILSQSMTDACMTSAVIVENCRSPEMWRSVDCLYFHWKYRQSTDLRISGDLNVLPDATLDASDTEMVHLFNMFPENVMKYSKVSGVAHPNGVKHGPDWNGKYQWICTSLHRTIYYKYICPMQLWIAHPM